jgi:hypothetical protein
MATATRNQTSIDGSLYDLVARGVKDTYFIKDEKDAAHPFQWTYERWPASLPEERRTNALNQPRWGQRCEFEFDLPADVLLEASLSIELPSWLPPEMISYNPKSLTYSEDASGNKTYYGYTNGIAYFMFEKIEIYQDKILLQEVSGDSLFALNQTKNNWNQGLLVDKLAGIHAGDYLSVMRNATPGQLKLTIPMIGCSWPGDRGLPLCGLRNQTFRLRLTLRPLEKLVESITLNSSGDIVIPKSPQNYNITPWNEFFYQERDSIAPSQDASGNAIPRAQIGQPNIILKTKQIYLLNEAREQLAKETIEVPYIRYFDNHFSVNQLDYAPIDRGGTANIVKFLDANYTVERIVTYFRNSTNIFRNRLYDFENFDIQNEVVNGTGQFYTSVYLTIAGRTREGPWEPEVWQNVIVDAKQERSTGKNLIVMDWSRGWRIEDEPPAAREPTGGINFTTADRPMLTVQLADITTDPTLGYKQAQMISACESWALYRIKNGRGGLEYAN